jgi:glycerol-3-phosphate dehydrogenase
MAGGKLTGYRPMARETLERAAEVAGLSLAPAPEEEPPLPGGDFDGDLDALELRLAGAARLPRPCAARLVRLYGTEALEVAARGSAPLVDGSAALAAEVEWSIEREGAATLEDVIYRRLRTALYAPDAREAAVPAAAARMAARLGWDRERTEKEIEQVSARLAADLAFRR